MLEHDAESIRRFDQLVQNSLLQVGKSVVAARFATFEYNDGTPGLIVGGVVPVAQWEGGVAVRGVFGIVGEVVDGDGEVVRWVEERWVGVVAADEGSFSGLFGGLE